MTKTRNLAGLMIAGALAAVTLAPIAATAQEATKLGSFNQWTAWQGQDANGKICYISSEPQQMLPTNVDHGSIHFLVIHRMGLGTRNEVQSLMGYDLKQGSTPTAAVDGNSYDMVPSGKAAWLASEKDEPGFVGKMKAGSSMTIKATSARGTDTSYTYSLSGVTAAMDAIDKACS